MRYHQEISTASHSNSPALSELLICICPPSTFCAFRVIGKAVFPECSYHTYVWIFFYLTADPHSCKFWYPSVWQNSVSLLLQFNHRSLEDRTCDWFVTNWCHINMLILKLLFGKPEVTIWSPQIWYLCVYFFFFKILFKENIW